MADQKLNGVIVKNPRDGAPSYVIGSLSFKVEEFTASLKENEKNGWVNANLKMSAEGKLYLQLDLWQPGQSSSPPR